MSSQNLPQTEEEFYRQLDLLIFLLWSIGHDVADGRASENEEKADKANQERYNSLVREACAKFNLVVAPEGIRKDKLPPAPEGKKYFHVWLNELYEKYNK